MNKDLMKKALVSELGDTCLISVVTVVKNSGSELEKTIQSIISQTYKNIEYIIIDGGSTDGTIDVIKKHEHNLKYWHSEPDKGISDAWNKGLAQCSGKIIGILNAGDTIPTVYLEKVFDSIGDDDNILIFSNTIVVSESGVELKRVDGKFNHDNLYNGIGFLHPGCFATSGVYSTVGKFKLSYQLAMDCDWILRCYRAGVTFRKMEVSCKMLGGGISNKRNLAAYGEYLQAMRDSDFSDISIYTSMLLIALRGIVKSLFRFS